MYFRSLLKFIIYFTICLAAIAMAQPTPPPQYTIPRAQDSVNYAPAGIDPAVRENDAGRLALPHRELMQRTYDVSGQKSEWVLGTSILGNPDLDPSVMGISGVSSRYPSKLSGIYTTRLGYDATTLTLNGENGILFEESRDIPVDTPITDLAWDRAAFTGNALRLDMRRLLTDSVTVDFGVQSRSNKESKEYEYQGVTHSPYFALGRDSSSIPFGGRNIAVNSMDIQPMLTWRFGFGKAFAKLGFISLENADNTNHKVLLDTLDKSIRTFQTHPYTIDISAVTYGAGVEFYPFKRFTIGTSLQYGSHDIELDSMGSVLKEVNEYTDTLGKFHIDSIRYDTTHFYTYQTFLGDFKMGYATLLNPTIKFEYEFLNTDDAIHYHKVDEITKTYEQDREVGYLQLADTLGPVQFRTQIGMQRNSSLFDEVDYARAYSADATIRLPFHLRFNATMRHDNKFADVWQQKFNETGRMSFANKEIKYEERDRHTANINWYSREAFYGLGIRHEKAENLIRQRWVGNMNLMPTTPTETNPETATNEPPEGLGSEDPASDRTNVEQAFQWTNVGDAETYDWLFQIGFRLGNWKFYFERGQVLNRDSDVKLLDAQELYYKGSIHWQNRFVQNRLGVSIRVDWQWFDTRYDCTINEQGLPELELMRHYLAMDFEARMQILSFELYTRIENFNHSIYAPASGYTPEGLRFSYGIVWSFLN